MESKNALKKSDKPAFLRVSEVAKILGLKRTVVYTLVHRGVIPHKRLGTIILIPTSYIENFVAGTDKENITE